MGQLQTLMSVHILMSKTTRESYFLIFSKNKSGDSILAPTTHSFSIDLHAYIAPKRNGNTVICQMMGTNSAGKRQKDRGFTLGIKKAAANTKCQLVFSVVSGTSYLHTSASIDKGAFQRIVATFNRDPDSHFLELFINQKKVGQSNPFEIGDFFFKSNVLLIGSGTQHNLSGTVSPEAFLPTQTFSGSIDEFRFFHDLRSIDSQKDDRISNIYANDKLKLYFKFNEPTGSYNMKTVVLDSSGNSFHSKVTNYKDALRISGSIDNPMTNEDINVSPVLFPSNFEVTNSMINYCSVRHFTTRLILI